MLGVVCVISVARELDKISGRSLDGTFASFASFASFAPSLTGHTAFIGCWAGPRVSQATNQGVTRETAVRVLSRDWRVVRDDWTAFPRERRILIYVDNRLSRAYGRSVERSEGNVRMCSLCRYSSRYWNRVEPQEENAEAKDQLKFSVSGAYRPELYSSINSKQDGKSATSFAFLPHRRFLRPTENTIMLETLTVFPVRTTLKVRALIITAPRG